MKGVFVVSFERTLGALRRCAAHFAPRQGDQPIAPASLAPIATDARAWQAVRGLVFVLALALASGSAAQVKRPALLQLVRVKEIRGKITPKSVIFDGKGRFFAQNMIYSHSVTVYDRRGELLKTIPDRVSLAALGVQGYPKGALHRGSPVEATTSHQGRYIWTSNYKMFGPKFPRAARDRCKPADRLDPSTVYRIDGNTLAIDAAILVGSVPKFLAVTPDDRWLLVSNWCSWDLSVVDLQTRKESRRIKLGRYPRGIAIDPRGKVAYIALMGELRIAVLDLQTFQIRWIKGLKNSPRHLCISPDGRFLYISFSGGGKVGKWDLEKGTFAALTKTGSEPRSMALSPDGKALFVVNYSSATLAVLLTDTMAVHATARTATHPIGIAYDPLFRQIWVACYKGQIQIFAYPPEGSRPLAPESRSPKPKPAANKRSPLPPRQAVPPKPKPAANKGSPPSPPKAVSPSPSP